MDVAYCSAKGLELSYCAFFKILSDLGFLNGAEDLLISNLILCTSLTAVPLPK